MPVEPIPEAWAQPIPSREAMEAKQAANAEAEQKQIEAGKQVSASLTLVTALAFLITHMSEHGVSAKQILAEGEPPFDVVDLIELAKWLKDAATDWKAQQRTEERTATKRKKGKPSNA
jgi:hypothetical protein